MAADGGSSALLVFPPAPFTLGQSPEMVLAHFKRIADATDLPLTPSSIRCTIGSRSPIASCAIPSTRRCSSNVQEATSVECALMVMAEMPGVAATSLRCLRKLASSMARSSSNGKRTAGMTPRGT